MYKLLSIWRGLRRNGYSVSNQGWSPSPLTLFFLLFRHGGGFLQKTGTFLLILVQNSTWPGIPPKGNVSVTAGHYYYLDQMSWTPVTGRNSTNGAMWGLLIHDPILHRPCVSNFPFVISGHENSASPFRDIKCISFLRPTCIDFEVHKIFPKQNLLLNIFS